MTKSNTVFLCCSVAAFNSVNKLNKTEQEFVELVPRKNGLNANDLRAKEQAEQ